jgi:hypothetical protein
MIPPGVDAALWTRYLQGARSFDKAWGAGERCPANPQGAQCRCHEAKEKICRYWHAMRKIAQEVGGATWELFKGMN